MLIVYPIKPFGLCISKCYADVATITDKVYSCYKNSVNDARDTRIFAAFHFVLRLIVIAVWTLAQRFLNGNNWFCVGMVFMISSLIIALIKPYNKTYMNYIDCLILCNLSVICYILSQSVLGHAMVLLAKTIIAAPIMISSLIFLLRKCKSCKYFKCYSSEENQQLINPAISYS